MKTIQAHGLLFAVAVVLPALAATDPPDLVIADFEGTNYGDWKASGTAFGSGPARGTLPNQMAVTGYLGQGLVNSFVGGDDSKGTLTSPPFAIERRYIWFLIGGGKKPGQACLNLRVDGQVVRTATGPNDRPGGTEKLEAEAWDVSEFRGRQAVLEIVDQATGGWGHVNVDQIVQTDRKLPGWRTDVRREMSVQKRYLILPVKNGAPQHVVRFIVDGHVERQFDIELAEDAPDWWAFLDLESFRGKRAALAIDRLREDSTVLQAIEQADSIRGATNLYREALRPQFHFTSRRGWNNDPNGLVFYRGEYHLFYQHNPYGWNWGNMHWGHAVSPDLVHWTELPIALYPDAHGTMFSGSAVVDANNTAGFQEGDEKPLVCIFTAAGSPFTQGLAYSNDRGRTWTKYPGNPVLGHLRAENRDPKVIWYAPEKKWVMALYLDGSDFALFESRDLKKWERMSDVSIPGTSECPEFFEIAVAGQAEETRWVFYGGNGRYLVGRFDGRRFTPESGPHPLNAGNCFYASQTFNDLPAEDGRRILIPWGQMATPGMPFNQMMGVPVELTLRSTEDGLRLFANPIRELALLRVGTRTIPAQAFAPGQNPLAGVTGELLDLEAEVALGDAREVGLRLRGVPVTYDAKAGELTCQGHKAALRPIDGRIRLRLLVDRTSIDIFGNDGRLYMPMGVIVPGDNRALELAAKGGTARIVSLVVHTLESTWKQQ